MGLRFKKSSWIQEEVLDSRRVWGLEFRFWGLSRASSVKKGLIRSLSGSRQAQFQKGVRVSGFGFRGGFGVSGRRVLCGQACDEGHNIGLLQGLREGFIGALFGA